MPPAFPDGPRQLPLDLAHAEARSRDDLVVGPSNAEAVALVDRWPDWPSPVAILAGPAGAGKSHLASVWREASGATPLSPAQLGPQAAEAAARGPVLIDDIDAAAVDEPGLYRLEDGVARAVAVVGRLNPPEFADLRTTASILQPVADATGAGVFWAAMDGVPSVRRITAGDPAHGRDWMGLVANGDYTVTGVSERSLAPGLAVLLLGLGLALAAWRREGA